MGHSTLNSFLIQYTLHNIFRKLFEKDGDEKYFFVNHATNLLNFIMLNFRAHFTSIIVQIWLQNINNISDINVFILIILLKGDFFVY